MKHRFIHVEVYNQSIVKNTVTMVTTAIISIRLERAVRVNNQLFIPVQ